MFTFDKLEQNDTFNFLKGGIVYADAITTVSTKYAEEIQTAEFGNGLEDTLRRRSGDLFGILNGVDYEEWDPATDPHIAAHDGPENLEGKKECRRDLLHAFGLQGIGDDTAVIGIVSRFATQKGFDFIVDIMDRLVHEDMVLVILGNGEEYDERLLVEMANHYPAKVRVQVKFDNVVAHKIEAGADMFLMPSRYEPGGLATRSTASSMEQYRSSGPRAVLMTRSTSSPMAVATASSSGIVLTPCWTRCIGRWQPSATKRNGPA